MSESLISREYVYTDVDVKTFDELVTKISQPLIRDDRVTEEFPKKVIEREMKFPTGLPTEPYGVAIPHTDPEYVKKNTITIAVLKNPIEMTVMGSDDEKVLIQIVFLLSLGESNKQMNILKKLMSGFQNGEILEEMIHGNEETVYQLAKEKMNL